MTFKQIIKEHSIENGFNYVDIDFVIDDTYYDIVLTGCICYEIKSNRLYYADTTIEDINLNEDVDVISFLNCVEQGIEYLLRKSNKDGYKTLINDGYLSDKLWFDYVLNDKVMTFEGYLNLYPEGF